MSGNTDDIKGRVKQAAGDLTDDPKLKNEGTADRASGKAKGLVDDLKNKADAAIDKVTDKAHRD